MNPVSFLREVKAELDKVVWPSRTQIVQMTLLIIVISIIVGAYVGGLDFIFTTLVNSMLNK